MKRSYAQMLEVAEAHEITVNIEVHGYFTTNPDMLERMLRFCDSPLLRLNLDTGNSFIAGRDPVAFCQRLKDYVNHVHIKDVSASLAAAVRGEQTGIAVSQCALGEGVNADNICGVLEILRERGFDGVLSMECEGQGGPMIANSLAWLRTTLQELQIPEPHAIDPAGIHVVAGACELAKQKKLDVLSGLHSRFQANIRETVQRIHDGQIGEIVASEENFLRGPYGNTTRLPNMTELENQYANQYSSSWLCGDDVFGNHSVDRSHLAQVPHGRGSTPGIRRSHSRPGGPGPQTLRFGRRPYSHQRTKHVDPGRQPRTQLPSVPRLCHPCYYVKLLGSTDGKAGARMRSDRRLRHRLGGQTCLKAVRHSMRASHATRAGRSGGSVTCPSRKLHNAQAFEIVCRCIEQAGFASRIDWTSTWHPDHCAASCPRK